MYMIWLRRATIGLCFVAYAGQAAQSNPPLFRVMQHIAAPAALWDYAAVDDDARRLYLGRVGGVLTLNLETGAVVSALVPSALVHGVLPIDHTGVVMSTNGEANTVTVFEGSSGRILATIAAGKEPDAIIYEPISGLVVTTNEGSHDLTLIDPRRRIAIGKIALPGKPEFPAAAGHGYIYDNIESRNEIAMINVVQRRVVRTLPLPGCDRPTGLAYDALDDLLISVCHNGVAKFVHAKSGRLAATVAIGTVPDAVLFDAKRRLVFIPCGVPGWLNVIAVRSASDIHAVQTLITQRGSRTGALDPKTGKIYLPAARFTAPTRPGVYPNIVPGSFEILVVAANPAGTP